MDLNDENLEIAPRCWKYSGNLENVGDFLPNIPNRISPLEELPRVTLFRKKKLISL